MVPGRRNGPSFLTTCVGIPSWVTDSGRRCSVSPSADGAVLTATFLFPSASAFLATQRKENHP